MRVELLKLTQRETAAVDEERHRRIGIGLGGPVDPHRHVPRVRAVGDLDVRVGRPDAVGRGVQPAQPGAAGRVHEMVAQLRVDPVLQRYGRHDAFLTMSETMPNFTASRFTVAGGGGGLASGGASAVERNFDAVDATLNGRVHSAPCPTTALISPVTSPGWPARSSTASSPGRAGFFSG